MSRRGWEDAGIAAGAFALVGGGLYLLDKQGFITIPTALKPSTAAKSSGLPKLNVAPLNLPNSITRRCGTGYVSFGKAPSNSAYIIVGKYTNGRLVSQYYQPVTGSSFDNSGAFVGGTVCGSSTTTTTTSNSAANYGWVSVGNGCYQAQPSSTLSGLAVVTGLSISTLAGYNDITNVNYIQVGQTVCTEGQQSSTGSGQTLSTQGYGCKYTVQSGNTLSGIAAQYGISYQTLAAANGIGAPYTIDIGQVIAVPCKKTSSSTRTSKSQPTGRYPGYFSVGYKYGYDVYAPAIPKSWNSSQWGKIPYVTPFMDRCAWVFIGNPKDASTGAVIKSLYTVASYNQNGTWTGTWAIIQTPVDTTKPFPDSCTASANWPELL